MLRLQDLKVSIGDLNIVNGIDLQLEAGESLSIIGESGAGKTTLGLAIMGLAEGNVSGDVTFDEVDLLNISADRLRRMRGKDMAMVFQNVEDALDPVYKVVDQVSEVILAHSSLDKKDVSKRSVSLLQAVGLMREKAFSYPHQLSGGEKQRVLIAMALANDPSLLILDEPTASLDSVTRSDILDLLKHAIHGKMTIVITHDISTAARLSTKMAVLYAGRIVEIGRTCDLLSNPRHPYTRGLIRSYPNMTTTKDLQGIPGRMERDLRGCPFHSRCTQRIDICSTSRPELKAITNSRAIACHRGGIVPLIALKGICKSFGSNNVLSDINFTLFEGETLAVVGESGSGKTTLAKVIMGLCDPFFGNIVLDGKTVDRRDDKFYKTIQMIYQNPKESLSHRMNVLQLVSEPLDIQKISTPSARLEMVKTALDNVELPNDDVFLNRYPHQLSGGEAQRVAIARAMVLEPKLLIADEPTSALDSSVQAKILRLLMNLQEEMGLSILFITHDIALARKASDRMAVLHHGRVVEEGPTNTLITNPVDVYTKTLIDNASDLRGGMKRTSDKDLPNANELCSIC